MKIQPHFLPLVAAVMLAGLGIYYFLFETDSYWWILLLCGSVFNMYLAWKSKAGQRR